MKMEQARAVVTGGASGLGHAVAQLVIARGGRVTLLDVQEARGELAARELGPAAAFVRCDISSEKEVDAAMEAARAHMGGINLLVNCAGVIGAGKLLGRSGPMPSEQFARTVNINLIGSFNCDKAAAAIMQHNIPNEDGERGLIVHTSSIAALEGQVGQVAYAATKAAIAGMTLPIARELAALGIRCVAIAPGLFDTPMAAALTPEQRAALASQVPFPARLGRAEEYARMVAAVFEIAMLNGETIRLDGALRMPPR